MPFKDPKKRKAYYQRPEVKAKRKAYKESSEYKAERKKRIDEKRLKILQHYSKRLSKSDIPCCRCCGLKSHIEFLAIDHIAGKKQMDSERELLKLGYSSSKRGQVLRNWIIKNNFPKGFQVLCHNCNYAKGIEKNNNKCPHQNLIN